MNFQMGPSSSLGMIASTQVWHWFLAFLVYIHITGCRKKEKMHVRHALRYEWCMVGNKIYMHIWGLGPVSRTKRRHNGRKSNWKACRCGLSNHGASGSVWSQFLDITQREKESTEAQKLVGKKRERTKNKLVNKWKRKWVSTPTNTHTKKVKVKAAEVNFVFSWMNSIVASRMFALQS